MDKNPAADGATGTVLQENLSGMRVVKAFRGSVRISEI